MSTILRHNLFVIPVSIDKSIIYAPLHRAVFYANKGGASLCNEYIEGKIIAETAENKLLLSYIKLLESKDIYIPQETRNSSTSNNLVVILSQMCNLSCSYCFAQESRSKDILSKDKLRIAIDYVLSKESDKIQFSFIGGGEPTLTWDLLSWAVCYIRSNNYKKRIVRIGLTTNGTLLNDSRIDFLKKFDVKVGLSFEILPSIQSKQRCFADKKKDSFEILNTVIKMMIAKGVYPDFRSTITQDNVKLMTEMVKFVVENYPQVKKLHFEHVTSLNLDKKYYDDFIHNFFEARKLGAAYDINIYSSVTKGFNTVRSRFCNGELCLTPTGDIVACHRISSPDDSAFDLFNYAKIDNSGFILNEVRKNQIEEFLLSKRECCSSCFAKWHCAGSCSMEKTIYSEDLRDLKCYFIKEMVKNLLVEKLESIHSKNTK